MVLRNVLFGMMGKMSKTMSVRINEKRRSDVNTDEGYNF